MREATTASTSQETGPAHLMIYGRDTCYLSRFCLTNESHREARAQPLSAYQAVRGCLFLLFFMIPEPQESHRDVRLFAAMVQPPRWSSSFGNWKSLILKLCCKDFKN